MTSFGSASAPRTFAFVLLVACALVAASGCGDAHPVGDADAGGVDAGAAGSCAFVDTVDRSCTTDADCVVRVHQTDCCGSTVAIGVSASAVASFDPAEAACMASYPGCGCPAGAPITDSEETFFDTSVVSAACVSRGTRRICLTYVTMRPGDGR